MNGEILLLFVILLLGLILCTYLGGSSCLEGMTSSTSGSKTTYTTSNGATATITKNSDGTNTLVVTNKDEPTTTYTSSIINSNTYSGPNGGTATVTTDSNGASSLTVTAPNGSTKTVFQSKSGEIYSSSNSQPLLNSLSNSTTSFDNYNHFTGDSHATVYYGPDGGNVKVIDSGNGGTLVITSKNGNTEIYYINENNNTNISRARAYYGPNGGSAKIITDNNGKSAVEVTRPNGTKIVYTEENTYASSDTTPYATNNVETNSYYGLAGGSITTATGPKGNTAAAYTGPNGNTVTGNNLTSQQSSDYYNSLPPGIPRNQIPSGQEDLYILKSQVVPPVCPACPPPIVKCDQKEVDNSKCPPCPPCGRCPEPAFDCKKVPNYGAFNQNYMPVPVLNSFSTFGT